MRRKVKPWQEKLDPFALAAIDAHRQTKDAFRIPQGDLKNAFQWLQENQQAIAVAFEKYPRSENSVKLRTVKLDKGFVKFMQRANMLIGFQLQPGENQTIPFTAEHWASMQKLYMMFEKKRESRALIYFSLAFIYTLVQPMVQDFRKKQFGPEPLDWEKKRALAAMCLEFVAGLLRGRVKAPKGRINLELIKFINLLQEHQTEPLTDRDLWYALADAGFYVPPQQHSWSIFLNRARKKELITKPKRNYKPFKSTNLRQN